MAVTRLRMIIYAALACAASSASVAWAQGAAPVPVAPLSAPADLAMPKLSFTPTPADEADYDKYFYFQRDNTTFAEAYADIKECDALSSGISFYMQAGPGAMASAMTQYGPLAGGIGGALGNAFADAIFGSAERRKQRRMNLRNCMHFKEYSRYGLNHGLWDAFNFEEGLGRKKEVVRVDALQLQAMVAAGPAPQTKELGL